MTDDTPPSLFSDDAERGLIGMALVNPVDVITRSPCQPEDFYIHHHQWIWAALTDLLGRKIVPDLISIIEHLSTAGRLESIGGPAYLASLIAESPIGGSVENTSNIVKDYAVRRGLLDAANKLARGAFDRSTPVSDTVSVALDRLSKAPAATLLARPYSYYTSQVYDEVEERAKNPVDIWGMETGLIDFDQFTGGLQKYEVFYLAGEPGIGKTKLMLQIAQFFGVSGHPGVVFSLEMRGKSLARRGLSLTAKIPTRHLKTGKLVGEDWAKFTDAVDASERLPVWVCDSPLSITDFGAQVTRMVYEYGIEWFALDYLLLLDGFDRMEETERSAALSRKVKNLVHSLPIAGITVNSVTKDIMDGGTPTNKGVRGSGQVVHDADIVAFLTKHIPSKGEKSNPSLATMTFTKGRELDGGVASIDLLVHRDYPGFSSVTTRQPANLPEYWYQKADA